MHINDFDFDLPSELIARYPLPTRSQSRLLHVLPEKTEFEHYYFKNLPNLLNPGDLLVLNDTRVLKARLFGHKASGGQVELLIERIQDAKHALVHMKASKSPKPGAEIILGQDYRLKVIGRQARLYELELIGAGDFFALLEQLGEIPLPPYMERKADASDLERYQTVYANYLGSVAAPTAGLHFDHALIEALQARGVNIAYVTLHVGAGTFLPVQVDDITTHQLHEELATVSEATVAAIQATKARGGRVIAVGTTSVRSLESAATSGELKPFHGDTRLFIYPGFRFHVIDGMITNFHLPKSSLLMLVAAFVGLDTMRQAYQTAIDLGYRFYSYGDAMLIGPK